VCVCVRVCVCVCVFMCVCAYHNTHVVKTCTLQVKGFINRIMIQHSGNMRAGSAGSAGQFNLGRERREKLCVFIERLEQASYFIG